LKLQCDPEVDAVFQSITKFVVGNGNKVLFWRDRWIGGRCAEEIAPLVVMAVATRRRNHRLVSEALQGNTWLSDINQDLSLEAWTQCIRIWEEIETVERNPLVEDSFVWIGTTNGVYSARDTYRLLCRGEMTFSMHKPFGAPSLRSEERSLVG
jgi:hypothetical protein